MTLIINGALGRMGTILAQTIQSEGEEIAARIDAGAENGVYQIDKIKPWQSIAIDCGVDDFFYPCNVALHEALLKKKIPHDYTIRPGGHNHAYWGNAILYQLIFFTEHFKRHASGK